MYSIFRFCLCVGKVYDSKQEEKALIQWENVIADNFLGHQDKTEANSVPGRVKASLER